MKQESEVERLRRIAAEKLRRAALRRKRELGVVLPDGQIEVVKRAIVPPALPSAKILPFNHNRSVDE